MEIKLYASMAISTDKKSANAHSMIDNQSHPNGFESMGQSVVLTESCAQNTRSKEEYFCSFPSQRDQIGLLNSSFAPM